MGRYRVTIKEAAKRLGVKEEAVRKRIRRNTIRSEKDLESGRAYVYIDEPPVEDYDTGQDEEYDASYPPGSDMLVRSQQEQIEFLRRELERKDAILLNMIEVMKSLTPATESSPKPRESLVSGSEDPGGSREEKPPENKRLPRSAPDGGDYSGDSRWVEPFPVGEHQQSREVPPREPRGLLEARQSARSPEEERPENADLAQQLKQLENWLQTRARGAQQGD